MNEKALGSHSLITILAIVLLSSCKLTSPGPPPADPLYSFFIAGHTYGYYLNDPGLHPPFEAKYPMINNDPFLEMGFLTGDMIHLPSEEGWDVVDSSVAQINMPVHFVAGNHDVIDRPMYESRYGNSFYHFKQNGDLFIVLDANVIEWLIDQSQIDSLKIVLANEAPEAENVFVFFHQLLWWTPSNQFQRLNVNNTLNYPDSVNFWTEVEPLFHNLPNNIVMFAGDLGAHYGYRWDSFMYYTYDNITFVASGMGNFKSDNFIIIDVLPDKSLRYRLIAINGDDEDALGKLEDYQLP